ncbi:TetR/AcrR family transcriptional regulator [Bosea sp. FBZP-16]|uniref:TetR/AcrR family transcriptional regulator n=1 Tax=Bosea sp. FBZP-16 TaxID=2065382 RepID=UPI000C30480B|nr:TetR/AcrR family transcriptional regulator [Bosea sp. FBZP-16]
MSAMPTRDRILDAAERLFAERGGADGASMRDLAAAAGVRLSQLSYHFGSKEALYRAVFARRAHALALARAQALGEAMARPVLDVGEIVAALIGPSVRQRFSEGVQGAAFAMMTAREAVDPREAARGVVAEHFDPTARQFVTALGKLYPQAPEGALVDAYLFMVGALVMTMAAGDRASRLDQPREAVPVVENAEHLLQRLTSFCAAGIDGLLRGR